MPRGKAWTKEDDARLRAEIGAGTEPSALPGLFPGRSSNALYHRLGYLGLGWFHGERGLRTRRPRAETKAAINYARPGWGEERQVTRRPCLRCGRGFGSEGPHNRMCERCRSRGAELSPFAP